MLNVENLSKTFCLHNLDGKVIHGVTNVSLQARKGEFVGLSGPSGAGKSSILKCIYRTYVPSAGRIWYDSPEMGRVDLASATEHDILRIRSREIGYVSQFLKVIPRVPAIEVVAEPLIGLGMPEAEAKVKAADLLGRLNVPERLFDAYPSTFSGGEQQRVNIARAIIWKPRLLLVDEPTASLDRRSADLVVDELMTMRAEGVAMIGILHDRELMAMIADRVYQLQEGAPVEI
ncbi:MAG TPA: phosphonate C-P lyase system protein PhnL [Methanocella sp.]|nr:phosphonate C-P lyase system protein PhnL [Methanocella sp.]